MFMARNMMANYTCLGRPLPTCKTSIVRTAAIFSLFKANIQSWRLSAATTKEVARLRPPHIFCGFLCVGFNKVNTIAVASMLVLHVGNGLFQHVRLDIMFLAILASCSLAVLAMRAWGAWEALPFRRGI